MAANDSAPPIDSRSESDIVQQTMALAKYYSGWSSGQDLGWVLVRIFSRMMSTVVERLNQVPENNHLAFLGLLGAQRLPPRPARVPLTFQLVPGLDGVKAIVPAGTPVAAPADETRPEAVFTLESELVLTSSSLVAVLVRRPELDGYLDATSIASSGAAPGAFVAFGGLGPAPLDRLPAPLQSDTLVPHLLYLTDAVFALRSVTSSSVTVTLSLTTAVDAAGFGNQFTWTAWNGTDYATTISSTAVAQSPDSNGRSSAWKVTLTPTLPLLPSLVGTTLAPWLRVTWTEAIHPTDPNPVPSIAISATANVSQAPDQAFANGAPIDLTKDFLPFGDRPRLGDAFYFSNADVVQSGSSVTVAITPSDTSGTVPPGLGLTLGWDCWDGVQQRWVDVTPAPPDPTSGFSSGSITLSLANVHVGTTNVNGVAGAWLRARVRTPVTVTTDFTKKPFVDYQPPAVKVLTLTAQLTHSITGGYRQNGFVPQAWQSSTPPFVTIRESDPALYLGFDRPFAPQATTIYLEVDASTAFEVQAREDSAPPAASGPHVVWEYSIGDNQWSSLAAEDDTVTLTRSGLLRFFGPGDFALSTVFGQQRYWIRGRLSGGTPALQRRLKHVTVNTAWASHATTTVNEVLGSSNGSAGQTFTLSQTPVLLGQRIEVNEGQLPAPDELAALLALEGADAVTVVAASAAQSEQVWVRWHAVSDFYGSGPLDRHYVLDSATGVATFGDGNNGRIPLAGNQNVRAARYQSGGGAAGNRAQGTITQLRTAIPYVQSVINNEDAGGGADAETLARVKDRSSRVLRHGGRAVTAQDYEDLAFEASATVTRATAITPTFDPLAQAHNAVASQVRHAGKVLLIVVPSSTDPQPVPSTELLEDVHDYIAARCSPSVELQVTGPNWAAVTVTADLAVTSLDATETLVANALAAVERFLHPLTGNTDGNGWSFGQQPHVSDFYVLFSKIAGIDHVSSLTVTCSPPLELAFDDPNADNLDEQRLVQTYLISSSGNHQLKSHLITTPVQK
jgi:hypothetical protein